MKATILIAALLMGCSSVSGGEIHCYHEAPGVFVSATWDPPSTQVELYAEVDGDSETVTELVSITGTVPSAKHRFVLANRWLDLVLYSDQPSLLMWLDKRLTAQGGCLR